jgi:hypothetical protein
MPHGNYKKKPNNVKIQSSLQLFPTTPCIVVGQVRVVVVEIVFFTMHLFPPDPKKLNYNHQLPIEMVVVCKRTLNKRHEWRTSGNCFVLEEVKEDLLVL